MNNLAVLPTLEKVRLEQLARIGAIVALPMVVLDLEVAILEDALRDDEMRRPSDAACGPCAEPDATAATIPASRRPCSRSRECRANRLTNGRCEQRRGNGCPQPDQEMAGPDEDR